MPERNVPTDLAGKAMEAVDRFAKTFEDTTANLKQKATDLQQQSSDLVDFSRQTAAESLAQTATGLHDQAASLPGEKVPRLAHDTADKLGATAEYMQSHDTKAMMQDLKAFVKSRPVQSLVAAAVLGLLVGRASRRRG